MGNGSQGCLSAAENLPGYTPKKKIEAVKTGSQEEILSGVFSAAVKSWAMDIANEDLNSELAKLLEIEQNTVNAMCGLTVSDIEADTVAIAKAELARIKEQGRDFRSRVRATKERYKEELSPTEVTNLDDRVERLLSYVKEHNKVILRKIYDIDPLKQITDFEKESLALQRNNAEVLQQVLKAQQVALEEHKALQEKAEGL